jgi:acyl-CoA dehydrogenase
MSIMGWIWLLAFLFCFSALAYHRASLKVWTLSAIIFLVLLTRLGSYSPWFFLFLLIFLPLNITSLRYKLFSKRALFIYRKVMPSMSRTEKEALAAGTVGWEGDLFCGNPDWKKLLAYPKPSLTEDEKNFIEGPVEKLCGMLNDWDITYIRKDLPPEVWQFLKDNGFFGLIVPKKFGGKEFSAFAHSQILTKIYSVSATAATTVAVPNSLGPAELLLHYGTTEQQNYYLPRLARGEEIPCFALTGPEAGSDAGAMTDKGYVCWGEFEGKKTLGIRLSWNKRYITLAPVATVIGLAFKLYDPEHLIGKQENLGITCVLIPRNTPGITIGRRHLPANTVFQNGPIQGKDVFIPVDWIIGGEKMAGQGWRMLMECLAAGRAISLPASSIGSAKALCYGTGAYAHVRRQFNVPIDHFEGIEEVLAKMTGYTYAMDATRTFTSCVIDTGEKPAVASAITKYHVTEMGRQVTIGGMDIHGGKAVCLGPQNYVSPFYQAAPIAITVEGANILTRSLIIFGQGAMRCHPYIFAELKAAQNKDDNQSLKEFDKALMGHMSFTFSNFVRSLLLGLTSARIVKSPRGKTRRYFQHLTRFSSNFALLADMSLIVLGGSLKRKESISARLGDILSYLYITSAVLKHYFDQGKQAEDLPIVRWIVETNFHAIQQKMSEVIKNFPSRPMAFILKCFLFPFGRRFVAPHDKLGQKVAELITTTSASRDRLTDMTYTTNTPGNMLSILQDALVKTLNAEPIEKIIKTAKQTTDLTGDNLVELAQSALNKKIITAEQLNIILQADDARKKAIAVDDFAITVPAKAGISVTEA